MTAANLDLLHVQNKGEEAEEDEQEDLQARKPRSDSCELNHSIDRARAPRISWICWLCIISRAYRRNGKLEPENPAWHMTDWDCMAHDRLGRSYPQLCRAAKYVGL